MRRSTWRTAVQQSREESVAGARTSSAKGVFKRMASLGGHSGRGSPATSEKDKMVTPGLAKKDRRASSYVGAMGKKKSREIRKFGGVTVKLSHR